LIKEFANSKQEKELKKMSSSTDEHSTKFISYAGGEEMWREWSNKTKAYGGKKGWL
jgi:hypothetical protein